MLINLLIDSVLCIFETKILFFFQKYNHSLKKVNLYSVFSCSAGAELVISFASLQSISPFLLNLTRFSLPFFFLNMSFLCPNNIVAKGKDQTNELEYLVFLEKKSSTFGCILFSFRIGFSRII